MAALAHQQRQGDVGVGEGGQGRSDTLGDALTEAARYLALFGTTRGWLTRDRPRDPGERVMLFDVNPGLMHVVGIGPLAEQIHDQLQADAVPGWRLLALPQPETPLHELRPLLDSRCYNRPRRDGFGSVEAVAATPGAELRELRNAGPKLIAAVRAATTTLLPGFDPIRSSQHRPRPDPDPVTAAAALQAALSEVRHALQAAASTNETPAPRDIDQTPHRPPPGPGT